MPHRQNQKGQKAIPTTREQASLLSVDRAVFELRRDRMVCIAAADGACALVMAAEGATQQTLKDIKATAAHVPVLAITRRRAEVLGLGLSTIGGNDQVVTLQNDEGLDAEAVLRLADPLSDDATEDARCANVRPAATYGAEAAGVGLAKIARLLPTALVSTIQDPDAADLAAWAARRNLILVDAGDVFQYERTSACTLKRVSEARVPLEDAENAQIIAYRPQDGGLEHLAIVIGEPSSDTPPLVRLHSECFTGDLLGSLRCDCGDQLRGAIKGKSVV